MASLICVKLQPPDSPMMVDPEDFDNGEEKPDVAIISPQQFDGDEESHEQEQEPRADDCMFFGENVPGDGRRGGELMCCLQMKP